jgi:hypothetical protein
MRHQVRRLGPAILVAALVVLVGLGTASLASGKKKHKPLKVSCEQLYAEIDKTGAQLQAKYNAMGFTIGTPDPAYPDYPAQDGFTSAERCQKQGKRVRLGVGFMNDIHSEGEPPFPGETNPAVREYFWTWSQTVTRTKKGKLRSAITSIKCEKYSYEGSPGNPQNTQTFPC